MSTSDTISQGKDVGMAHAQDVSEGAQQRAGEVAGHASDAAKDVAGTAVDQAQHVKAETARQVRDLTGEATSQLSSRAKEQTERLTSTLQGMADELKSMAGYGKPGSTTTELVHQASERMRGVAGYLEGKEPNELLDEVRAFARRRPGAFLAGAAALGLVAGRIGRGAKDATASHSNGSTTTRLPAGTNGALPVADRDPVIRLDEAPPTGGFTSSTSSYRGQDPVTGALLPERPLSTEGGY